MCAGIEVKGLQDAVYFAVGAVGEDVGVGASHAHFPSQQTPHPGQSSMAQGGNSAAVEGGGHDDGREQRDGKSHEPHLRSWEGEDDEKLASARENVGL